MKIDKKNLFHWLLLSGFFLQCFLGLLWRGIARPENKRRVVVLYGHKLNGNLRALYDYMSTHSGLGLRPIYMTMDPAYRNALSSEGVNCVWAAGPGCARTLANASVLISDHGLHALTPFLESYQRTGLFFVDVWHGIPFKGFDRRDFIVQRRYDEVWVASESQRALWINQFGFEPEKVYSVGYARTERLIDLQGKAPVLRAGLGLPECGKILLFAPTWAQDAKDRSLYPFDTDEQAFLGGLSSLAERYGATVVLRSHLNSLGVNPDKHDNIIMLPASDYPDTEAILSVSDVLICDWSSIAFDFLLLHRPAFFLDVAPPFKKGFSLGPDNRYGVVVSSFEQLLSGLDACLQNPEKYWQQYQHKHQAVREKVYGKSADGNVYKRSMDRLLAVVNS